MPAPRRLAQPGADEDDDHDGDGEDEERGAPRPQGGEAGADEHAGDGADADARAVRRVDPGPGRDGVPVGQQRIVGREDHRLPHGHADQCDGRPDDGLGHAEPDGEGGADQRTDEGDADAVGAVGQDRHRQRAGEGGGAGDGDDEEDAGVGEVERVADVRDQHVEGALGGLVQQFDGEEHAEGEQRHAAAELGELEPRRHGARAGSIGAAGPVWRVAPPEWWRCTRAETRRSRPS